MCLQKIMCLACGIGLEDCAREDAMDGRILVSVHGVSAACMFYNVSHHCPLPSVTSCASDLLVALWGLLPSHRSRIVAMLPRAQSMILPTRQLPVISLMNCESETRRTIHSMHMQDLQHRIDKRIRPTENCFPLDWLRHHPSFLARASPFP